MYGERMSGVAGRAGGAALGGVVGVLRRVAGAAVLVGGDTGEVFGVTVADLAFDHGISMGALLPLLGDVRRGVKVAFKAVPAAHGDGVSRVLFGMLRRIRGGRASHHEAE